MTTAEATPEKAKCPTLEITKQDFFQEAKTLIAKHYEKINENKVQGTSINVFRKKHQKLKSGKYLPLEIDKKETHDVVQEHRAALRRICFPKELSKSEHLQEPPQRISFKEPHIFSRRERCRPIDLITKGQVKLDKIMTIIEPVSKKMETAKQQHFEESRMLELLYPFPVHLYLQPGTSTLELLKEPGTNNASYGPEEGQISGERAQDDKAFYDWRGFVPTRSFSLAYDSGRVTFSQSSSIFRDYYTKESPFVLGYLELGEGPLISSERNEKKMSTQNFFDFIVDLDDMDKQEVIVTISPAFHLISYINAHS
ncbi:PREDICTED: uncharacterized protein LOC108514446 [Rhinopithecus bieti]|uniref:uncharacterized protein LOC108514446 n=1 Tax=Rhinopithecus bieti TaxID=61621 RepID=UPI00083BED46|nr:PREDICTED: uncharacterized protein LOC108514446 [Rhinopithecus bieti]